MKKRRKKKKKKASAVVLTWRDKLRIRLARSVWRACEKNGMVWLEKGQLERGTLKDIHLIGADYGTASLFAVALNMRDDGVLIGR